MVSRNMEMDVFDDFVEPEMMCVGQATSSPILHRKGAENPPFTISSVFSRRLQNKPERQLAPLQIDLKRIAAVPQSAKVDSGVDDVFDSPDGQGPGLERLYNLAFPDFDDASDENAEDDDNDSRNGTLPIAIPSIGSGTNGRLTHFASVSETSELGSGDSALVSSLSSGLRRRTSSVSLTVYQWSRLRAAYAKENAAEGSESVTSNDSGRGNGLGRRSISGPCLQSPSRSIATQTPTENFSFEFPENENREDVTDRRNTRPSSSWNNETSRGNRFLLSFFGGILNRPKLPDVIPPRYSTSLDGAEEVGQDLRIIGDNFDLIGCRSRAFSMDRRRSSS